MACAAVCPPARSADLHVCTYIHFLRSLSLFQVTSDDDDDDDDDALQTSIKMKAGLHANVCLPKFRIEGSKVD